MTKLTCAAAPCRSCPYRKDVPSGVWASEEYVKLPAYDGEIADQIQAGATGVFMCHQQDGKLCAGWVGCHGASNLIAMRLAADKIEDNVWDYESPVPLFTSGLKACMHGVRALRRPGKAAKRVMAQILRKRARLDKPI